MKRREIIYPGYKAYNGHIFDRYDCNAYNSVQLRINSFIDGGLPVPESLLDESHRVFDIITTTEWRSHARR
jgi:hypothetical protein